MKIGRGIFLVVGCAACWALWGAVWPLQERIDALAAAGGGTLTLTSGVYKTGALFFKNGVRLHLERGAVIEGVDEASGYPMMETRIEGETCLYYPALINADHCDGFTISGEGVIDGHGLNTWKEFWKKRREAKKGIRNREQGIGVEGSISEKVEGGSSNTEAQRHRGTQSGDGVAKGVKREFRNKDLMRPRLLYVSNSKHVDVSGVTFKNSKFWTTHYYRCEDVTVHDCTIVAEVIGGVRGPSTDAIDIDACRNVTVRNVVMDVNDDAVVVKGGKGVWADDYVKCPGNGPSENVLVEKCLFKNVCHTCLTLGSECPAATNIVMRDCTVEGAGNLLTVKMRIDTPQHFKDVRVERCCGTCRNFFNSMAWAQYTDLKGRREVPESVLEGLVMTGNEITCEVLYNVRQADFMHFKDCDFQDNAVTYKKEGTKPW